MPITQQRMLQLIATAEEFKTQLETFSATALLYAEQCKTGEMSLEDFPSYLEALAKTSQPRGEFYGILERERAHFKYNHKKNEYNAERIRQLRARKRQMTDDPRIGSRPQQQKLEQKIADGPMRNASNALFPDPEKKLPGQFERYAAPDEKALEEAKRLDFLRRGDEMLEKLKSGEFEKEVLEREAGGEGEMEETQVYDPEKDEDGGGLM